MRRALTIIASAGLLWGLGLTGAAAADDTGITAPPKECTSDGPSDVVESDGSDTLDGAPDRVETDGSDTKENDWSDTLEGRLDRFEGKAGQIDDNGKVDPEGSPDTNELVGDFSDGASDRLESDGSDTPEGEPGQPPDNPSFDYREEGDTDDAPEANELPGDDVLDGASDKPDGASDRVETDGSDEEENDWSDTSEPGAESPEENFIDQPDDNGKVDPEGSPEQTDVAGDETDLGEDEPETDGSDAKETDGSDALEPEDCTDDAGADPPDDNAGPTAGVTGEACDAGGVGVLLDNSKADTATEFTIVSKFGGSPETVTVTVPAGETKNAVAPAPTDVEGTVTVSANGEVLVEQSGTLVCGNGGTGFPTGDTELEQTGSQLPFTGSPIRLIALVAVALIAAGGAFLGGLKLVRNRS